MSALKEISQKVGVSRVMEDDRIEVNIGDNVKVQIIRSTITSLLKKEEKK